MKLILDGPQTMLARTAAELEAKHHPVERLRQLRDAGDELGYSPKVWSEMADLGWLGIPISEHRGGLGMGMAEVVLITEAMGRALAPEPFLSAVMAARLLASAGGPLADAWLPSLIDGERRLAVALYEPGARFDFRRVSTTASAVEGGWKLDGQKAPVDDGYRADGWIVSARTAGADDDADGIALFLVPADRKGVRCTRMSRVDSRNAATVFFDGVLLSADDLVGEQSYSRIERHIDASMVALCGEMLGGMSEVQRRTLDYLREREQFGAPIGSFQALQHRAAKLFIEIELARSTVMAAARALDECGDTGNGNGDRNGEDDSARRAALQASNAKARCSDAYILATNEGLQMHGGIGMTDEHDIGLFLKRARVAEMTFGDGAFHRDRFARLSGF